MTGAARAPVAVDEPEDSTLPWHVEAGLPDDVGFLARLARLTMLANLVFDGIVEPFGLSFSDYLVLGVVRRSRDGQSSPIRLCEMLGRTTGGMTLTIDRLASNGWLERSPNPVDRRRIIVTLTPGGHQLSIDVNTALHNWELAIEPAITRQDLRRSLDRLLAVVAPDPPAWPGPASAAVLRDRSPSGLQVVRRPHRPAPAPHRWPR